MTTHQNPVPLIYGTQDRSTDKRFPDQTSKEERGTEKMNSILRLTFEDE